MYEVAHYVSVLSSRTKCGIVLKTKFSAQHNIQIMHSVKEEFVVEEIDNDEKQVRLKDIF